MQRVKGLKQLSGKKSVKKKQPKGFPAELSDSEPEEKGHQI